MLNVLCRLLCDAEKGPGNYACKSWTYNTETKHCLNIFEKAADDQLTIKHDPKFISGRRSKPFQSSETGTLYNTVLVCPYP